MKKSLMAVIICLVLISCQKMQEVQKESQKAQLQNIYDLTTEQQLKQWDIVSRNGTQAEKYIHAGIVAACYLQAGNESKYKEWSAIAERYNPMK